MLPFANIGGDASQDYFVDGVTESLTTDLSRISGAFVIGRSTAFTYRGTASLVEFSDDRGEAYVRNCLVERDGFEPEISLAVLPRTQSETPVTTAAPGGCAPGDNAHCLRGALLRGLSCFAIGGALAE